MIQKEPCMKLLLLYFVMLITARLCIVFFFYWTGDQRLLNGRAAVSPAGWANGRGFALGLELSGVIGAFGSES